MSLIRAEALSAHAVLAIAGAWGGRLLFKPAIRREVRAHPWLGLAGFTFVGITTALVVRISLGTPAGRRLMAAGVAGAAGLAWFGARPRFGQRRGLPPGSLGLGVSLDAIDRADFYQAASRRWGPVFKMRQFHQPVVCVTDLPMARAFLRNQRDSLRQVRWPFDRVVPGGYVEFMAGDRHARYREMFRPGFDADTIASCRPHFALAVRRELEVMGGTRDPNGVAPLPYLERIALSTLLRVVVGLDPGDSTMSQAAACLATLERPIHVLLPVPASSRAAFGRLMELVRAAGTAHSGGSTPPLPPSVMGAILRSNPDLVHDDVIIGNLVTMLKDGRNMLRMLLMWMMHLDAECGHWATRIRTVAATDPAAADRLAYQYVLEVLRTRMTPHVYRRVVRDCSLDGFLIPRGWLVRVCLEEAHHRPDVFVNPVAFNPARFAGRDYGPDEFMPFSGGEHACLADRMVLDVGVTFLRELATGYDLQYVRRGPAERENRHWAYRIPSRHLRVRLLPVPRGNRSVPAAAPPMVTA